LGTSIASGTVTVTRTPVEDSMLLVNGGPDGVFEKKFAEL
jgi:hypothetical protein